MGLALAKEPEQQTTLRAEFVERISAAWHKSRERILALGRALIEAKQQLSPADFAAMITTDLPFGADQARRFIRIAADPRLASRETSHILPETVDAMDTLQRLDDQQFERAVGSGRITPKMTVREARELVQEYLAPAPFAVDILHRRESAKIGSVTEPANSLATSWPEFLWLLIDRRKTLGISQLDLDQRIGWGEGQTSKYEIPHADDGRIPGAKAMFEWMQALRIGAKIEALA